MIFEVEFLCDVFPTQYNVGIEFLDRVRKELDVPYLAADKVHSVVSFYETGIIKAQITEASARLCGMFNKAC